MPISIPRLRTWFALVAIATVLAVAGFYFYAQYRIHHALKQLPKKIGIDIQQSTENFTLSKSEGGHTLFTIKASKAVQYRQGGHAQLNDVSITVYGRHSERFDQIYGKSFAYDPQAGTVSADGEVAIDLQAAGDSNVQQDQAIPRDLKNPVHLKTSGLVFNQKTGIAQTDQAIEFRIPQANGSAMGAVYDSKENRLTLQHDVKINTEGERATTILARSGFVTKEPQQIELEGVTVKQQSANVTADRAQILISPNNTIDRVVATGNVTLQRGGESSFRATAPRAEIAMGEKNTLRNAVFSGRVQMSGTGSNSFNGTAGRIEAVFAARNAVDVVHLRDGVHFVRPPGVDRKGHATQGADITTQSMDLVSKAGKSMDHAETLTPAQIVLTSAADAQRKSSPQTTTVAADRFRADFAQNRLSTIKGTGNAKLILASANEPDRVTTSSSLTVQFAATGGVASIAQEGNFEYRQAARGNTAEMHAYADRASYTALDEIMVLTGSPRVTDGGTTLTADQVRLNRRTGEAFAQGSVKTTYSDVKQSSTGALLASSDPIHVTARAVNIQRQAGIARYTGGARLWQGPNVIEAPAIEFNRNQRSLLAQAQNNQKVSSVFVETDKQGKTTPVVVTAGKLTYVDAERRARYTGGVVARGADATVIADEVTIVLQPAGTRAQNAQGPAQLQQIVAGPHVVIQQAARRGTGEKLVYNAQDASFVLTGGPPTITDAERGTIRGDSLTFYSHDDRVVVESAGTQRTVTRTKINQ